MMEQQGVSVYKADQCMYGLHTRSQGGYKLLPAKQPTMFMKKAQLSRFFFPPTALKSGCSSSATSRTSSTRCSGRSWRMGKIVAATVVTGARTATPAAATTPRLGRSARGAGAQARVARSQVARVITSTTGVAAEARAETHTRAPTRGTRRRGGPAAMRSEA